jgi:hypothetical protein
MRPLILLPKYLGIFAVIGHLLIQYSKGWLSARECWVMHWLSLMSIFLCSSLVTLTLAFRCYIIFERKRRIGWVLLCFVAVQLAASMTLAASLEKVRKRSLALRTARQRLIVTSYRPTGYLAVQCTQCTRRLLRLARHCKDGPAHLPIQLLLRESHCRRKCRC